MEFFTKSKSGISLSLSDMIGKLKRVIQYTVLPNAHPVKLKIMMQKQKEKLKGNIFDLRLENLMNQKKKYI